MPTWGKLEQSSKKKKTLRPHRIHYHTYLCKKVARNAYQINESYYTNQNIITKLINYHYLLEVDTFSGQNYPRCSQNFCLGGPHVSHPVQR